LNLLLVEDDALLKTVGVAEPLAAALALISP